MASKTANSPARSALLVGATGLVGRELLQQLRANERYSRVYVLARRALPELANETKVELQIVNFDALPQLLPTARDVFIALGTTIAAAGSKAAFRRVDFDYVVAVAQAARSAGAERLAVVSAVGADATSRVFYNRVKGEMQAAVSALGYDSVILAQPSLLLGDREALGQAPRPAEALAQRLLRPLSRLIPLRFRPIRASEVAAALLQATLSAARGVRILSSADLFKAV